MEFILSIFANIHIITNEFPFLLEIWEKIFQFDAYRSNIALQIAQLTTFLPFLQSNKKEDTQKLLI